MKVFKSLFLATLVLGAAAPAFANEEFNLGGDEGIAASDVAVSHDDGFNTDARRDRDRDWRRPRPRAYTCFARNATGRTFSARDWNANRAQREAVRHCRARSFGPIGFSCRAIGCRR